MPPPGVRYCQYRSGHERLVDPCPNDTDLSILHKSTLACAESGTGSTAGGSSVGQPFDPVRECALVGVIGEQGSERPYEWADPVDRWRPGCRGEEDETWMMRSEPGRRTSQLHVIRDIEGHESAPLY